jgi:hypothetical protein
MSSVATALAGAASPTRRASKFKKRTKGFLQIDFSKLFYNFPRLLAGRSEIFCLMYVLTETQSASRAPGTPAPDKTRPISTEEFQWYVEARWAREGGSKDKGREKGLSAVQHSLQDLCDRKILHRREALQSDFDDHKVPASLRGWYVYWIPAANWDRMPAYDQGKDEDSDEAAPEQTEAATETPAVDDLRQQKLHLITGTTESAPLTIEPRRPSKSYPAPVPIEKVQFVSKNCKLEINPIIYRGRMTVELTATLEAKEKRKSGAEFSSEKNISIANTRLTGNAGTSFGTFLEAGTKAGLPASREDWNEAERIWKTLSTADRLAAVRGIEARIDCGEFMEAQFRPRPDKYLEKRAWERPLRPSKTAKSKHSDSNRQLMEMAEEVDRQMASRGPHRK